MSDEFVPSQTSVPDWLMTYCRQLAEVYAGRKLNRMYAQMLEGFLKYKPWESTPPFNWRIARVHAATGVQARKGADLGWTSMNMMIPTDLYNRIKATIDSINEKNGVEARKGLSLRTFLYTAVCWWCSYVFPYKGPGVIDDR